MRAFLALPIPADIVAYLKEVIGRLERRTEGVRWVRDEGIHITVKFLGEIEEAMAERMRSALAPIGAAFGPFRARLGGLDAFPSRRSARVIVVKLKEGVEQHRPYSRRSRNGLPPSTWKGKRGSWCRTSPWAGGEYRSRSRMETRCRSKRRSFLSSSSFSIRAR